ncbi:MAG: hypothetical protein KIS95_12165 [Anaerolineae bacterium]|uniref:hypothetical protein n=1 Tax=Promineifilum sp. TaxID=2664178 RepID=UPI001D1F0D14|nr:hypothetical protein [Anaerolineales bacterium]MCO5181214.1 hypothetical protein [Promineifilum sp.]MCW5847980.1 hypothetical protein [Anaerolineae bacterium]
MLRRTRRQFTDSIDMLRAKDLRKYADVFTSDGERIGVTLRFVHRPIEDVNEKLRLYRTYLVVQSILLGGPAYVPTNYVAGYDPAANRVDLAVDLNHLEEETWNREPDFVVRGLGVYEELPE